MNDRILFRALAAGAFKRTAQPSLIRIYALEIYLKYCSNKTRLCKAIAYSMVYPLKDRHSKEWQVVVSASGLSESRLEYVCVFSKINRAKTLKDLVAVDFSILYKEKEKEKFLEQHPNLRTQLLKELELIWKS